MAAKLRYTKRGKRYVKTRKLQKGTADAVKAIVKRAIARSNENYQVGYLVEDAVAHNSAISAADCEPLIGPIAMDTDGESFERRGDKISPKSLKVNGVISLNNGVTGGLTQTPVMVRVIIAAQKDVKVGSAVSSGSIDTLRLLKPNNPAADEVDYSGATINHLFPINKDLFRVYMDKTFVLCGSKAEGVEAINQYCVRWSKTFTKKQLPSHLTFDEGNGDWANNFAPFLAVGYSYPDGSSPDSLTRRIISTCFSQLTYEDA